VLDFAFAQSKPVGRSNPIITHSSKREFVQDGDPAQAFRILDGWVAGFTILADGRRQVVDLFLPGDVISSRSDQFVWNIGLLALTTVRLNLVSAFDINHQLTRSRYNYQTNAIIRLGCLTAYERVAHLFLEIHERSGGKQDMGHATFDFPLTQELMADLLGLSPVHINRTLQQLRRDGLVLLKGGKLCLLDLPKLKKLSHFVSTAQTIEA
jgi:CRP-like cAMP-binding protein